MMASPWDGAGYRHSRGQTPSKPILPTPEAGPTNLREFCEWSAGALLVGAALGAVSFCAFVVVSGW
jgi:hypothetical protein